MVTVSVHSFIHSFIQHTSTRVATGRVSEHFLTLWGSIMKASGPHSRQSDWNLVFISDKLQLILGQKFFSSSSGPSNANYLFQKAHFHDSSTHYCILCLKVNDTHGQFLAIPQSSITPDVVNSVVHMHGTHKENENNPVSFLQRIKHP